MWYVLLFCQLPPGSARGRVENLAKVEQDKTTNLVLWIGIVLIPIRIRLSILMPIQIRIRSLPNLYTCWKKQNFLLLLFTAVPVCIVLSFLASFVDDIIFNILDSKLNFLK
jgi:hypothetical protein